MKLSDIAEKIHADVIGDPDCEIERVADIRDASEGSITFLANDRYRPFLAETGASAVIADYNVKPDQTRAGLLQCENPSAAFGAVTEMLYNASAEDVSPGVDKTAFCGKDCSIADTAYIGPGCVLKKGAGIGPGTVLYGSVYIGMDVTIGAGSTVYPNVSILRGTVIGDNVTIHSGGVIGSDGFGYETRNGEHSKIKQLGNVEIHDNVEIGACVTVDRARFGSTVIGRGTKIDNLVQIAHNVHIGKNCIIVAQVGISGSTHIGDGVVMAGRSGTFGHININDRAVLTADTIATKDIREGETVSGFPARPSSEHRKAESWRLKLPEIVDRVKELENRVKDIEA